MKKKVCIVLLLAYSALVFSQDSFRTTDGKIRINASTPLEDIDATNSEVNAILKAENGDFAAVMLIRDFQFRRKLMQEHFNENFMESDTYPKAYFRGNLEQFSISGLSETPRNIEVKGQLTIHGQSRELRTTAQVYRQDGHIELQANFLVRPEDHGVKVPKILFNKIAEEVSVDVLLKLFPEEETSG